MKFFVPLDSTAVSVGADETAAAIARAAPDAEIVRTGSRGMFYLEPLVEIEQDGRRFGYGPVTADNAASLVERLQQGESADELAVGDIDKLMESQGQKRVTFARCGVIDPVSIADYEAHGGLAGLRKALSLDAQAVIDEVKESGLRGRGGAAFPTGIKWQTVKDTEADLKFVVANADEGDSGTYADRMLMEGDPLTLLEGMTIAALAVGATEGYIYLRSEYPDAKRRLTQAIEAAREYGMLGDSVLGSGHRFDIELRIGAGAYICGEETSLLESLEGDRGMIRYKPPLPAIEGYYSKPTVMNNVISLATVPAIMADGAAAHAALGTGKSLGTLTAQLCGNIGRPGMYEIPFGMTIRQLLEDIGGGSASGRPIKACQIGGPLGAYSPDSQFDTPLDYESMGEANAMLGHGGVVVFDDSVDMYEQARFSMAFCARESCGKCTPCRIGSTRGVEVIDRIHQGNEVAQNVEVLQDLCDTMEHASLCALGGLTPYPVRSALKYFPEDFHSAARESLARANHV